MQGFINQVKGMHISTHVCTYNFYASGLNFQAGLHQA